MYYRRALELQAFLDMATEDGIMILFRDIFVACISEKISFQFVASGPCHAIKRLHLVVR